ncbi:DUF3027 domain-containing protein [Microbacterium marinilacus]|uniref:DUF3027 domain-containing protein n=1 Tax=Microbacterium marinilacus TaxID=415209 RepID=A0ABP7BFU5_9MICO|nr:DUF3027 domain-containing protein [Microbacterium marinilacus]MBY0688924.1 DUF3027 domain-containing protein [Microbacterium marinilacus]
MSDAPEEGAAVDAAAEDAQRADLELPEPDRRLLEAHDLALAALGEITPAGTVGPAAGHSVEPDGVVSLRFENTLLGYPGWYWTVSLAVVEGAEPTVLEAELLPGHDALLAPDWVPWAVRLKEYQAAQAVAAAEAAALTESQDGEPDGEHADDEDDLDERDDFDDDAEDFDDDGSPILHGGDLDGVDIDTLDTGAADDADGFEDADDEGSDDEDGLDDESDEDAGDFEDDADDRD